MAEEILTTPVATVAPKRPRGRPRKIAGTTTAAPVKRTMPSRAPKVKAPVTEAPSGALRAAVVTPMDYIFTVGRRKRAVARVFLYRDGAGEVVINKLPLEKYFTTSLLQEVVRAPLAHSALQKAVRIAAYVTGGGVTGQAEAVRLGITRGLLKLDETLRPAFKARGFLRRDPREKERKKPGLKRARRGPQWAKR